MQRFCSRFVLPGRELIRGDCMRLCDESQPWKFSLLVACRFFAHTYRALHLALGRYLVYLWINSARLLRVCEWVNGFFMFEEIQFLLVSSFSCFSLLNWRMAFISANYLLFFAVHVAFDRKSLATLNHIHRRSHSRDSRARPHRKSNSWRANASPDWSYDLRWPRHWNYRLHMLRLKALFYGFAKREALEGQTSTKSDFMIIAQILIASRSNGMGNFSSYADAFLLFFKPKRSVNLPFLLRHIQCQV